MTRRLIDIPCFNEADNLPGVIADLRRHAADWDWLFVNDTSTDDTERILRQATVTWVTMALNVGIAYELSTDVDTLNAHQHSRIELPAWHFGDFLCHVHAYQCPDVEFI